MTVRIFPNRHVEIFREFELLKSKAYEITGYDALDSVLVGDTLHVVAFNITTIKHDVRSRTSDGFFYDLFVLPLVLPTTIQRDFMRASLSGDQDLFTLAHTVPSMDPCLLNIEYR